MEEKQSQKRDFTFWSIPNFRSFDLSFLGKSNPSKIPSSLRTLNRESGFTLIELLVVIIILAILTSLALVTLNPITQIAKGQDSKRQHDLKQLQSALDSYYNDNNYYPQSPADIVTTKNIQTIPNDPTASSSWPNYAYVIDASANPQWNVLLAKTALPSASSFSCPLEKMTNCLPENYKDAGYNYCVVSGNINCGEITSLTITPLPVTTSSDETPPVSSAPTPPITTSSCSCSSAVYVYYSFNPPSNQCGVEQPSSDSNVNHNRYCTPSTTGPCTDPCTPP